MDHVEAHGPSPAAVRRVAAWANVVLSWRYTLRLASGFSRSLLIKAS